MESVDLATAFDGIDEHWAPRLVGELNGQAVKLAKVEGAFLWHHHDADELFLVVSGAIRIEAKGEPDVELTAGQFAIVPRGVEHRPVADEEAEILLFEPAGTRNTGNVENERTREVERLE